MTKTKLLLAGVLAGAVALGTGCKTDKGTTNTGTDQPATMATDAGTGGAGMNNPTPDVDPLPQEGTREMEPGVHDDTLDEPGTGGTGLEPEPMDRTHDTLGGETSDEPLNPGAPANQPMPEEPMMNDTQRTTEPKH